MTPGGPGLWKAIHQEAWACIAERRERRGILIEMHAWTHPQSGTPI